MDTTDKVLLADDFWWTVVRSSGYKSVRILGIVSCFTALALTMFVWTRAPIYIVDRICDGEAPEYPFLTTYKQTIFDRRNIHRGQPILLLSRVIHHKEILRNLDTDRDNIVSRRECMFYRLYNASQGDNVWQTRAGARLLGATKRRCCEDKSIGYPVNDKGGSGSASGGSGSSGIDRFKVRVRLMS